MRLHNLYFTLLIFGLLILASCSEDDNNEEASACTSIEKGTKIMPLGASRVQGFPGLFESYRYSLWKDLVDGAFDFDFVGTNQDLWEYESYKISASIMSTRAVVAGLQHKSMQI